MVNENFRGVEPHKISLGVAESEPLNYWARQLRCLKSPSVIAGDFSTPKPPLVKQSEDTSHQAALTTA